MPMKVKTSTGCAPAVGTRKENLPSMPVAVPKVVPFTRTVTPGMGMPFSSVTTPVSVTASGAWVTASRFSPGR